MVLRALSATAETFSIKKGYTVYMSNYSMVNLKHSIFLTQFECWLHKDVMYSQNTGFLQKGNGIDQHSVIQSVLLYNIFVLVHYYKRKTSKQ